MSNTQKPKFPMYCESINCPKAADFKYFSEEHYNSPYEGAMIYLSRISLCSKDCPYFNPETEAPTNGN